MQMAATDRQNFVTIRVYLCSERRKSTSSTATMRKVDPTEAPSQRKPAGRTRLSILAASSSSSASVAGIGAADLSRPCNRESVSASRVASTGLTR